MKHIDVRIEWDDDSIYCNTQAALNCFYGSNVFTVRTIDEPMCDNCGHGPRKNLEETQNMIENPPCLFCMHNQPYSSYWKSKYTTNE